MKVGLYAYPLVMIGALAALCSALWAGLDGSMGPHESLLCVFLSLLIGWGASARFDRLEKGMTK